MWIAAQVEGGWEGPGYFYFLLWALGAWAVAVLLYLAWVVSRAGMEGPGVAAVLVAAVIAGAYFGYQKNREGGDCRAAHQFYERLDPAAPESDEEPRRYRAIARLVVTQPGHASIELTAAQRERLRAVEKK